MSNNADLKICFIGKSLPTNYFNYSTTTSNHLEKKNENNKFSGSNNHNNSSESNENKNLNKGSKNNSSDSNNKKGDFNHSYSYKNFSSNQNNSLSNNSNFISEIFQMKNYDEKSKNDSLHNASQLENFKINLLKYNLTPKDPGINANDNSTLISSSVFNEALNNKLLKKLILTKIEEIFSSNDMNHKIALINMMNNSAFFENERKIVDSISTNFNKNKFIIKI